MSGAGSRRRRLRSRVRRIGGAALLGAVLAAAGCGGSEPGATPEETPAPGAREAGGALGGGARTATLARQDGVRPGRGKLVWSAWRIVVEPGRELRHRHETGTVFAEEGAHRLEIEGRAQAIEAGAGAAIAAGTPHTHAAPAGERSQIIEVLLAAPGTRPPGARNAERVFQSEPLEGVPESSTLQFIEVRLAPGAETSVHTHPGPEFIFGTSGRFVYENAIEGARRFAAGDTAGIPPGTPVQKRNDTRSEAVFLSWFLVDPDEPFAPPARFEPAGQ